MAGVTATVEVRVFAPWSKRADGFGDVLCLADVVWPRCDSATPGELDQQYPVSGGYVLATTPADVLAGDDGSARAEIMIAARGEWAAAVRSAGAWS